MYGGTTRGESRYTSNVPNKPAVASKRDSIRLKNLDDEVSNMSFSPLSDVIRIHGCSSDQFNSKESDTQYRRASTSSVRKR